VAELDGPVVALRPMTSGGEVVEDYGDIGLTLRNHPVSFPREDLAKRRIVTFREAMQARDGKWLEAAGLVLVCQPPGSAKGLMFITIEDESGIGNLLVWVKTFEKYRRIVLGAGMRGAYGRIQREGEVVHLVAHQRSNLSSYLGSVGGRDAAFPLPHGRGDEFHNGAPRPDPRGSPKGPQPRDIVDPDLHLNAIKAKARDFR